jgi:murein DD-endopeptidase MepM/ murein hydrolase activator NlpD
MTFRLLSVVALLAFPALVLAQSSSTAGKSQTTKPVAATLSGGAYPPMSTQAKQRAEKVFEDFNNGQMGALWASLTDGIKKNFGTPDKFLAGVKERHEKLGSEKKMLAEIVGPALQGSGTIYTRLSEFTKVPERAITMIQVDEQGQVDTFAISPVSAPYQGRFGGYKDVTKLKLPFSGEWFVLQGGRSTFLNGYFPSDEQRFSLDFALVKNGRVFSGDGAEVSQYYCFGQPVLAPADGTIVMVQDGFEDNPPGHPTRDSPRGNMVLISHGNSEFSLVDHLKQNSVRVKKGDKVKQGDTVAECGNSGPSAVPHIHYMLQNSGGLPLPDSLPAQFVDYYSDGKLVASGEPEKGQMVSNTPPGSAQQASTK